MVLVCLPVGFMDPQQSGKKRGKDYPFFEKLKSRSTEVLHLLYLDALNSSLFLCSWL